MKLKLFEKHLKKHCFQIPRTTMAEELNTTETPESNDSLPSELVDAIAKAINIEAVVGAKETQSQLELEERLQTVIDEEQIHQHQLERKQAKMKRKHDAVKISREQEGVKRQRDHRHRCKVMFDAKVERHNEAHQRRQEKRERKSEMQRQIEEEMQPSRDRDQEYQELAHQLFHSDRKMKIEEEYSHSSMMREADIEFANSSQRINAEYAVRMAKVRQAMVDLRNEARSVIAERDLRITELAQSIANKYGAPLDDELFE